MNQVRVRGVPVNVQNTQKYGQRLHLSLKKPYIQTIHQKENLLKGPSPKDLLEIRVKTSHMQGMYQGGARKLLSQEV